jgi:integrase
VTRSAPTWTSSLELQPFTRQEVDALAAELGPTFGPLVVFAAETGLRTYEWVSVERRDIDRLGRAVAVPPLAFPASRGGYVQLDTWRSREWYPALDAAGIAKRGPYNPRHTFATQALAAGVSIFELARVIGASVKTIDKHYGHLAKDSEDAIRARL